MKYQVPKIPKSEILIIEVDNTNGEIDTEKVKIFFKNNNISKLTEFESPYEIKLKTAIRTPACSLACVRNPEELKIPLGLEQILVFKNTYYGTPENTEEPTNAVLNTDGRCSLCGQPATHVCYCPECQDALAEDGDDPDEGRPMCNKCSQKAN
jgi:hypothetical protein